MTPFREVFFNIDGHVLFYALAALATGVFAWGMALRWRFWRTGWREARAGGFDARLVLGRILLNTSFHRGDLLGGVTHMLLMWGFVLLFIGTVLSTLDHWFITFLRGDLYLAYAFVLDAAGVALIAGVLLSWLRRYVLPGPPLETLAGDNVVLALLLGISATGFLVEGHRLDAVVLPWVEPSPIGMWIAGVSDLDVSDSLDAHRFWWWVHAGASLALVAWLPFSKLVHAFAAAGNVALEGVGSSSFLALEEREAAAGRFSFRHLLMVDACTRCDRCTDVCPSAVAREPLSPRRVVDEVGRWARGTEAPAPGKAHAAGDQVWYCTTCGACQGACPSAISPLDLIREVRAARVESGQDVPDNLQEMLESVYKFRNPWQGAKGRRLEWASGLDVPVYAEGARDPLCFYVGCTPAYDSRLREVPRAAVAAFRAAGVGFGVLGKEEGCCSEMVRGVGEDGLFTELASANLDAFGRYGVREIATLCPHGMHTFRAHYARLDPAMGERSVLHVSQVLERAVASGALVLEGRGTRTVTFHDPCYLGRHGGVYDAPRSVIRAIPGVRLVEMERARERSLCCGGGGGRMWVEAGEGEKIAEIRVREAAATGADTVVTACPFCFSNLDDAVKTGGFEGRLEVVDLAELVARSLPGGNRN